MQDRLINAILQREYSTCKEILEKVTDYDLDEIKVPKLAALADYEIYYGKMPFIHWATVAATPAIFKLIMQVPDINLNQLYMKNLDHYDTPLTFVLLHLNFQYSFEIASLLIEDTRTQINHDTGNFAPLQFLCSFKGIDGSEYRRKTTRLLVALLQRPDVNVNQYGKQNAPLILASKSGFTVAVRLLLQHPNIDVNVKGSNQKDALFYARRYKHPDIVELLLQHKYGFIDMTPLESEVLPPTFDIATDLPYSKDMYKYPRDVKKLEGRERKIPFDDLSPFYFGDYQKKHFQLNRLDYNNQMIGKFLFHPATDATFQQNLRNDYDYVQSIERVFTSAYKIYTGIDETSMKSWPIAQKVVARKTYIGSMIQAFYDELTYPKFVSDLKNRKHMIRSWFSLAKYTFNKKKEQLYAATLLHVDMYPLLYLLYSFPNSKMDSIILHSWVRSVEGTAKSNSQNVSLGAMTLSLFISTLECFFKRSILFIYMQSLEGTDKVIQKISTQIQEPLVLINMFKLYKDRADNLDEPDCLIVTDELRNYYKRYLNVEEPSQKKPKVAINHCIACHLRADVLFKPQGIDGQVFCGQDCYEHYHGVHEHYLH